MQIVDNDCFSSFLEVSSTTDIKHTVDSILCPFHHNDLDSNCQNLQSKHGTLNKRYFSLLFRRLHWESPFISLYLVHTLSHCYDNCLMSDDQLSFAADCFVNMYNNRISVSLSSSSIFYNTLDVVTFFYNVLIFFRSVAAFIEHGCFNSSSSCKVGYSNLNISLAIPLLLENISGRNALTDAVNSVTFLRDKGRIVVIRDCMYNDNHDLMILDSIMSVLLNGYYLGAVNIANYKYHSFKKVPFCNTLSLKNFRKNLSFT